MSARRRATRLLSAATVATVAVTGLGVLLGPGAAVTSIEKPDGHGSAAPAELAPDVAAEGVADVPAGVAPRTSTVPIPDVAPQAQADFTTGADLPAGSRVFNTASSSTGMALEGGLLGHGPAESSGAAGFVETKLSGKVRSLGARVRFPSVASGSVALVGWQSSLVEADRKGRGTPATGLRLVAGPGHWELSVVNGEVHVIATGVFVLGSGAVSFEIRRDGQQVYVFDPAGAVTVVDDKRVARLAGPWASWGLTETGPEQTPASIEAVWAG